MCVTNKLSTSSPGQSTPRPWSWWRGPAWPTLTPGKARERVEYFGKWNKLYDFLYNFRETGDLDPSFINIVSTQAVCLLKLGDYVTSKKFAEQVCITKLRFERLS